MQAVWYERSGGGPSGRHARALEQGALRPLIGARHPLDRVAEAHAAVERGTSIGNVVLQL